MSNTLFVGTKTLCLSDMAAVDIRNMEYNDLTEIGDIKIDRSLPVNDRIKQFIEQAGNPYCFKSHGIKIKISFVGNKSLTECLTSYMRAGCTPTVAIEYAASKDNTVQISKTNTSGVA